MGEKGPGVKESGENETSFYQQVLGEERLSELSENVRAFKSMSKVTRVTKTKEKKKEM